MGQAASSADTTSAKCTPWDPAIPEQSFQNLPDPRNIGIIVLLHKTAFSSTFFYSSETARGDHRQHTEAGPVKTREVGRSVPSPGRRLTEHLPADLLRRGAPTYCTGRALRCRPPRGAPASCHMGKPVPRPHPPALPLPRRPPVSSESGPQSQAGEPSLGPTILTWSQQTVGPAWDARWPRMKRTRGNILRKHATPKPPVMAAAIHAAHATHATHLRHHATRRKPRAATRGAERALERGC